MKLKLDFNTDEGFLTLSLYWRDEQIILTEETIAEQVQRAQEEGRVISHPNGQNVIIAP